MISKQWIKAVILSTEAVDNDQAESIACALFRAIPRELGRSGGLSKSQTKTDAARANKLKALADGKNKGGRPKKNELQVLG